MRNRGPMRTCAIAGLVGACLLTAPRASAQLCAGDAANPNIAADPGGSISVSGGTCVHVLPGVPVSGRVRTSGTYTVTNEGVVTSNQQGLLDTTNDTAVDNRGTVDARRDGIELRSRSRVTNASGAVVRSTTRDGVQVGADSSVQNDGTIEARNRGIVTGADSTVNTTGSVTSTNGVGILTGARGTVDASGLVSSRNAGIRVRADSQVTNAATITSTNREGIRTDARGSVSNSGTIDSAREGILTQRDGVVTNSGVVRSSAREGIQTARDGTVTNTGTVTGAQQGVRMGNGATLTNAGTITSTGSQGVRLTRDATVTNSGTIRGTVGVLFTNRNNTLTTSGTIEGTGGDAIVFDRGTNTLNLQNGARVVGDIVGGSGTDALGLTGSGSYGGAVLGFESVTRSGSGTWAFSGTSTIAGPTDVLGGTFEMNGDWTTTALSVGPAGGLAGIGTLRGPASVLGRVAPGTRSGRDLGTLTLDGDASFGPSANLVFDVSPGGRSDLLAVTGTADLGGARATVDPGAGLFRGGEAFDVVVAGGGLTGNVSGVSLAGPSAVLSVSSTTLSDRLRIFVSRSDYASLDGLTPNQHETAGYLDRLLPDAEGDLADVMSELDGLAAPALADAFSQLDSEPYGQATSMAFATSLTVANRVSARLRDRWLERAVSEALVKADPPADPGELPPVSAGPTSAAAEGRRVEGWVDWLRIDANQDPRRDTIGYELRQDGVLFGFDLAATDRTVVGVDAYALNRRLDYARPGARGEGQSLALGLYGSHLLTERLWIEGDAHHAWHDDEIVRQIAFGTLRRRATGERDARQWSARMGLVGAVPVGPFEVISGFHLLYGHLDEDGFDENGAGSIDLSVSSRGTHSLRSIVGLDLATRSLFGSGPASETWRIQPHLGVYWVHEFLDHDRGIRAGFVGSPGSFRVLSSQSFDDGFLARAGLSISWRDRIALRVAYQLDADRGDFTQHALTAGLEFRL